MRRLARCGTTLVSHSVLGGAALQRCEKTRPPPRTGRARLQPCHPEPIKKRALAPEAPGRLPRNSLQRVCHPARGGGRVFAGGRVELWLGRNAAEQINLALVIVGGAAA